MARSPTTISSGTILGFYPPSIAQAFQRAVNGEPADADLLYEDLLGALLSHLAWTTALATGGSCVRDALGGSPASLGTLLQIVRAASAGDSGDVCDPLLGVAASKFASSPVHAALDEAIRLRNAVIHENRLDLRESARSAVRRALDHASNLRFQAVIVPRALEEMHGTLRVYRAACYRGLSLRHPVRIETDVELTPKHAYLAIEGRTALVPLHPIVVEGENCAGGVLSELYVVRDLGRLSVRSVALGREAPVRVRSQVESALRAFEPREDPLLRPKYFACPSLAIVASRRLGLGDVIAEEYRVVRYIGSGHSSDVYEATNARGEACALKLVAAEIASEAQVLERFRREVGVLRRIRHRNILRHVDDGEDAGARFVVTELANGWSARGETVRDASELLASATSAGAAGLDESAVLDIARDVAAGLAELHERGIVHRDVKLSNVLLFEDADGRRAVLGDLGIARGFGSSAVTYDGMPVGTPESMAPECGESPDAAPTLDVYAFGILLYEALTGSPPFRGATPQETRARHRTRLPPLRERAPDTSDGLISLVRACLAKNPASRPRHGAELHARLERLHESMPDTTTVDIVRGHRLGHYAVHEPIGAIDGATLFRAVDDRTGATVRVGILDDAIEGDEVARRHALGVLAALQATHCDTLVRVREYGEGDGYTWFLVEDAAPVVLTEAEGLEATSVLTVVHGAANALSALHRLGIGHGSVRSAARFHPAASGGEARALLDLPGLRGSAITNDVSELVEVAQTALSLSAARSGHAVRARRRALRALEESSRSSDWSPRSLASWALAAADDIHDGSVSGRLLRGTRRHRVVTVAVSIALTSAAGFGVWRVVEHRALIERGEERQRRVAELVQGKSYCEALDACRADPEAAIALPALGGRTSVLEILCGVQQASPPAPLAVLAPLARAIEGREGRVAADDAKAEPYSVLGWAGYHLARPDCVPDEYAYAFWRITARACFAGLDNDRPLSVVLAFLEANKTHFDDKVDARAQGELDSCLGAYLECLYQSIELKREDAQHTVDLVDRRLNRTEDTWYRYAFEVYRALGIAALRDDHRRGADEAIHLLSDLASAERFEAGMRHAQELTDRVYEPGYMPDAVRAWHNSLRLRCQKRAEELELALRR